ncbi:MAG: L-histidine N(alpha)-methyltransferase [Flavobacteriales bacterium]
MKGERPDPDFAAAVREGLSSIPKSLSSKHFYDARGDELFQCIMNLEEYYPTRAEHAILERQGASILNELWPEGASSLKIVEMGAGDGAKTRCMFKALPGEELEKLHYVPTDISQNVLEGLQECFARELPRLRTSPMAGDHYQLLESLGKRVEGAKALLFLGGNFGNFDKKSGDDLLFRFAEALNAGDRLLIGFDLKKDPRRIHRAYDDEKGVTKAFNLNLLERMNRELGADIDPDAFLHYPIYDPLEGEVRSYLVSKKEQVATIEELDLQVTFDAWEAVFTERSRKFSFAEIRDLAERTGFREYSSYTDPEGDFVDAVWVKE